MTITVALCFAAPVEKKKPIEPYEYIGVLETRSAKDLPKSDWWTIGAETMDRDYTIYKNWREYLGPLGAKKARIQSGWNKTEKEPGVYDWAWMDEIVNDTRTGRQAVGLPVLRKQSIWWRYRLGFKSAGW
jgi:hypothetical protein